MEGFFLSSIFTLIRTLRIDAGVLESGGVPKTHSLMWVMPVLDSFCVSNRKMNSLSIVDPHSKTLGSHIVAFG